jgi:hypothetical protein
MVLSARRSCVVSATSSIRVFTNSGVVDFGGVLVLLKVLNVVRKLVRFVCTREAICSDDPLTSSTHRLNRDWAMENWKRIGRVFCIWNY